MTDLNQTNKKPKKKRKMNKLNLWALIVSCIVIIEIVGILAGSIGLAYFLKDKPELSLDKFQSQESSVVYDADGNIIAELGMTIRENVNYDELPTALIDAFVAVEDSRFFAHNGFDIARFTKAIFANIRSFSFAQGGSTFTMQLVKNTYFVDDEAGINAPKKIGRKVQEIALAMELENNTNKKTILELYLNKLNFGGNRNIRGVQKAANYYYGKDVSELNLAEAALLAGVINAPNAYNPFRNLEKATRRRNEVLYQMLNHGYIQQDEYELAKSIKVEDLLVDESGRHHSSDQQSSYQAYIDAVISEIYDTIKIDPYTVPMEIHTYMDRDVQTLMDNIQNDNVEEFSFPDEDMEVAAISINNQTGAINAVLGGRNYADGGELLLNHAIDQYKQPGSSIKPIVDYALAFEYLGWSTSHVLVDRPIVYPGTETVIHNAIGDWVGEVSIKDAVGRSLNTPAIQTLEAVIEKTSISEVVSYLNKMGFDQINNDNFNIQFGIGGGEITVSVLQMAGAQAALINGGQYNKPHTIQRIDFLDGRNPIVTNNTAVEAISPQAAYLIDTLLYNNVYGGYANLMQILRDDYAVYAKTGTTDWGSDGKPYNIPVGAIKDAWMIGSSSEYTAAVWLGYEKASLDKQSYIRQSDYLANIQGHITNLILDKNVEVHGKPEAIKRPDGISSITHILATFPYASPIEGMDEKYITTGEIKTSDAKLVDPQTSSVDDIDQNGTKAEYNPSDNNLKLTWPKYPDESKLNIASEEMDISLYRADGSSIVSDTGTRLFDYSWVFGPIRYIADIKLNDELAETIISDNTEKTIDYLSFRPGDKVEACLYYAFENKKEIRSANSSCHSFTLENNEVAFTFPSGNYDENAITNNSAIKAYRMKVEFNSIQTSDTSKAGKYTYTFKGQEYEPGITISAYLSDLYDANIKVNLYTTQPRSIHLTSNNDNSDKLKIGSEVTITASLSSGTITDNDQINWTYSNENIIDNIQKNTNSLVIKIKDDTNIIGEKITITATLNDGTSASLDFEIIDK